MILTMNNFILSDQHYLQIHGTAMGIIVAHSFANLFLSHFETNALSNVLYKPHKWLRYIDVIFVFSTAGLDKLRIFIDYLNNIHPTITFTSSHFYSSIPFLDANVSLKSLYRFFLSFRQKVLSFMNSELENPKKISASKYVFLSKKKS